MPSQQWMAVPNSILTGTAAQLAGSLSYWSNGDKNPMSGFSGGYVNTVGIYDSAGRWWPGPHFCIYGGGHVDYAGNEQYFWGPWWDPNAQWRCARPANGHAAGTNPVYGSILPTIANGGTGLDGSGNPMPFHNYCAPTFIPTHNWLFVPGMIAGQSTSFQGSISGATLTVTGLLVGGNAGSNIVAVGLLPVGGTIAAGTTITGQLTGTPNGIGTYSVNISQTVASNQFTFVGTNVANVAADPNYPTTLIYDHTNPNPSGSQPWGALTQFLVGGIYYAGDMSIYDGPNHCAWIPAPKTLNATTSDVNGRSPKLAKYDFSTKSYSVSTSSNWSFGYGGNGASPAYDEKRNILGLFSGDSGAVQFLFFHTTDGINGTPWQPTFDGTSTLPPVGVSQGAMIRDWRMDRFVCWLGGSTLYFITPPATNPYSGGNQWHCQAFTPSGGATPPAENGAGTYGKFAYMDTPVNPAYVVATNPGNSLYAFRPK